MTEALAGAVGEALANAAKHGGARRTSWCYVEPDDDEVFVSVKDDGVGFDTAATDRGRGPDAARSGVASPRWAAGSRWTPGPGRGTEVRLWAPVRAAPLSQRRFVSVGVAAGSVGASPASAPDPHRRGPSRPRPVAQRRAEGDDLAVDRHREPVVVGGDDDLRGAVLLELGHRRRPAHDRAQRDAHQLAAGRGPGDVEADLAAVEHGPLADAGGTDVVAVVADEHERRAQLGLVAVGGDVQPPHREAAQHPPRRDRHRADLAPPPLLADAVADADHRGVDAERRVVHEAAAVDLGHVDEPAPARTRDCGRRLRARAGCRGPWRSG